ncbi:ATP-binding cassette domain-containing protein [candidate division CSSED10-310 bacterium]|uniref:ATP-binding cassette domain-containing protein n=1 Tax=candidate division CSSED10-310 bacterium TaxID=2855610 RepID=A0ABV6YUV9_UNCC1
MIETVQLHKKYDAVTALHDVSFTAENGCITGLLGPNGAGKSTTLRAIYGLIKLDHGKAAVDGFNTAENPVEARSRLGALPDKRGLYPRLTARENIQYFGRLHGMNGSDLDKKIERLIDLLDMKEFAHRRTLGFSTGQQLKVNIARALIHDPPNVLLDEPTNGLDVMSTRALRTLILRLCDEGKCVLLSTHIMQEVSALCQNIVIIANGKVNAAGPPDVLLAETGEENLEDAFIQIIGSGEGLMR